MQKYKYRARTKTGDLQIGEIEAGSRAEASGILLNHGLYVLFVSEVRKRQWYDWIVDFFDKVTAKDLMVFTRQFSTLLSSKIALDDSLRTLQKQTENPKLKEIIKAMAIDIESGLSLSHALEKHEEVFSTFYVNMIRSAEITGKVSDSMEFLAGYMEKQQQLTSKVKTAFMYPTVMILLFGIVSGIMIVVVFPQIGPIFEEAGVQLPIYTRIFISGAIFLSTWWWLAIIVVGIALFLLIDYLKTKEGKTLIDEILFKIPVAKKVLRELYVARFADSLSVLLRGGIPVAQAVEITGHTIGSARYSEILHETSNDLRKGSQLSSSLSKNEELFPPLVTQMIAVGEDTGRIDELLSKVAEFYTREVEGLVSGAVELIQPVLMIIIGVLVGGLFASILIPIYDLASTF